jgi:hypothetical protein
VNFSQVNKAIRFEKKSHQSAYSVFSLSSHSRPCAPFAGLLVVFLSVLLISSLQAKPKATPDPLLPSIGRDVSASVIRGGSCELDLVGIAMPGETVEFKINKNPKHGALEGPRRMDRGSVSYTYRHNGKKGADADRVEFGLKTGSGNAWGMLTARISIVEPRPMLVVEGAPLDFGVVPIGQKSSKTLKIRNAGAGVIRGEIKAYAPWSLEQAPHFELKDGDDPTLVRVIFAPTAPGEITGRLELEIGSKPYRVDLRGEGVYSFKVAERLALDEDSRVAFLDVKNLDAKDLILYIDAPPPLVCESKITVPAGGSAQLQLAVKDEIYTQKFVDLAIADGPAICSVRVDLPASPVKLEWEGAPVFDARSFPLRNVPELQIGLKNEGATTATVRLVAGEGGLRLPPSQAESFEIREGETALVKAIWSLPEVLGEARAKLAALQGEFATELELIASVAPPDEIPAPAVNTKKPDPVQTPSPGKKPAKILSEAEKKELKLRLPTDILYRLEVENGTAAAVVTWNYRGTKPVNFQLERKVVERVTLDPGKVFEKRLEVPEQLPRSPVIEKWQPLDEKEASIECMDGTAWQGRVMGLRPGYHDVRIVVRAANGKQIDGVAFVVKVEKLPRPAWMVWALWVVLVFSLFLLRRRIAKWLGLAPPSEP